MSKYVVLWGLSLLLLIPVPAVASNSKPNFKKLVEEAWQAVNDNYYDSSFGGLDWSALRRSLQARSYSGRKQAYAAIRKMLERLGDPGTRFLRPQQATSLLDEFSGKPQEGLGLLEVLSVDIDEASREIVIVTPVAGGPAAREGLKPGDVIVSVDGASAKELGLAETMSRLRGRAGSSVDLAIRRDADQIEVRIQREKVPAVTPVQGLLRRQGNLTIGYLGLRQFTSQAPVRMKELIERFEGQRVEAYVLDLRNNPGGYVEAVQQIAAFFLGEVPIARILGRSSQATELKAQGPRRVEKPVAVLINEGSASAAEVLAAALQDRGRAILLGTHTFGKGLVHGFQRLSDGSAVTPTLGRLMTLGGRSVLKEGVRPDRIVAVPTSPVLGGVIHVATSDDLLYEQAVKFLAGKRASDH